MKLFKYQGTQTTGGSPGETVQFEGLSWKVTEAGHLEIDMSTR